MLARRGCSKALRQKTSGTPLAQGLNNQALLVAFEGQEVHYSKHDKANHQAENQ
ncbi:hypothetical protein CPPEL_07340 [Corynebacterium pseudopelargi]|uniref:Uncharacterized protein n=1 Tax=Corynebacterium pseudopelargi TaxID=2080757 RepID=A0A3G6IY45_9CORY|nr:hypothetical protein CPPEL_07340 [Corynebacterium pseudopelargi]